MIEPEDDAFTVTTWESRHSGTDDNEYDEDDDDLYPTIRDHVIDDIQPEVFLEIDDYVPYHLLDYASPSFHTNMLNDVTDAIYDAVLNSGICEDTDSNHQEIAEMVAAASETYFDSARIYPIRSYPPDTDPATLQRTRTPQEIKRQIVHLKSLPQPPQRTPEWYSFRHNLLTASSISDALGTPAQKNKLICEKCKPAWGASGASGAPPVATAPNVLSATHHGQKYEQVAVMIYEAMYPGNRVDTDFGCIRHPGHAFIGASPDGVVVAGPRMGHMLEIKNTVSRVIDDTPILKHWVQCQVQMQVCDLEYCDYLQTCIGEISQEAFYAKDDAPTWKGVILYLISKKEGAANYKYLYMPISDASRQPGPVDSVPGAVEAWTRSQMAAYADEYHLFETLYWRLQHVSCVIIPRNRAWFQAALPYFAELWATVEHDRVHGYEHRLPKKRGAGGGGSGGAGAGAGSRMCGALYNTIVKLDA